MYEKNTELLTDFPTYSVKKKNAWLNCKKSLNSEYFNTFFIDINCLLKVNI